jgi:type I restriction enzyme S subunit
MITRAASEDLSNYKLCRAGDLVINRMRAFQGALGIAPEHGVVSPDYAVLRVDPSVDKRWLNYFLTSGFTVAAMASLVRGIGGTEAGNVRTPRLNVSDLQSMTIPLVSADEQRAVADYLDRETGRIDTLVEEQQRLIEMLRERRDSAWAARVETARRVGRPVTVRRVIESIVDGPFGSSLTSAHYSDEGARVIRLGNIGVNEFKDGDAAFIPLDYAEELEAHAVEQGDVVVAGLGDDKMPLGRAAVVPALGPAIVKADCYRLRPDEQVSAAYLAWVMSAPQTRSQSMLLARGSTRARLNTKVVQQVEIPLPDRDTQDALVALSDAEAAKIDNLIMETEQFIELSKERRSALITAAVTGLVHVREMV